MSVRIRLATTPTDFDQLFKVRHRVFMEEKRYFPPTPDGRLVDRFDAFPTTANIIAVAEGRVVGGVRIVEPSPVGVPADHFFDFGPYLPAGNIRVGSGSMLVVEEQYRRIPRVTFAMLGMMYYWALRKGLTHITGVAATEAEKLFLGSGYVPVHPRFFHPESQLEALPVVLEISKLNDRFAAFVDRHDMRHFLKSFERQFHQAGETIISAGEPGSAAYVIVEGRVGVSVGPGPAMNAFSRDDAPLSSRGPGLWSNGPTSSRSPHAPSAPISNPSSAGGPMSSRPTVALSGPPSSRPGDDGPRSRRPAAPVAVREMGSGEVFGELSLITSNPRSANVVALTDVDLMVLEREAFHKQVAENPQVALNLLAVLGRRLTTVTDRLQETTIDY
jgi:CRP-like cAMP-binding protein/N-acyl-L-homoserine lactone synthetase